MQGYLEKDLQSCLDENINDIQSKIKNLEERCIFERKPQILAFQEAASLIQNTIPHFTIRFLNAIDNANLNLKFSENEFLFMKDLVTSIFRVIGYFRKFITLDQMDVSFSKLRVKNNVVHQALHS